MIQINYAPIVIPTLCRYNHFRNCIESLSKCKGSEYTDVYVCLDYPAKESHVEGYKQILNYLENNTLLFKKLVVLKRESNCGESLNLRKAYDENIFPNYDRWILSEDDNIFSKNFLKYINLYLEYYKNDETITSVSGYTFPIDYACPANAVFKSYCMSPWGAGYWVKKLKNVEKEEVYSYISSFRNIKCLLRRSPWLFVALVSQCYSGRRYGDQIFRARNIINNTYSIVPAISKVRNCGYDASGVHCGDDHGLHANQRIDPNDAFVFVEPTEIADLDKKYSMYFKKSTFAWIKAIVKYIVLIIRTKRK